MPLLRARQGALAALAAAFMLVALTACGAGSTSSESSSATTQSSPSATTATQDAACADAAALKSSLQTLTAVKPLQDGLTALNTAITNVKTSLHTAAASASAVLKPDVDQVKTAFGGLQTAASGLTTDNLTQKAPAINAALTQVRTATTALTTTLSQTCPGR